MTSLHFNVGIKPWFHHHWDSFRVFPRLAAQAAVWDHKETQMQRPAEAHVNVQSPAEADSDVCVYVMWAESFSSQVAQQRCANVSGAWRFGGRFPPTRWPDLCRVLQVHPLGNYLLTAAVCYHRLFLVTSPCFIPVWLSYKIAPHAVSTKQTSREQTLQIQQKRLFRGRKAKFISVQLSRWN